jgi:di/tricarboxylate transporter
MTIQIGIVLALLLVALVLFSTERIPIEIVAILLVMGLVITNTLTPNEAFAGSSISSDAACTEQQETVSFELPR